MKLAILGSVAMSAVAAGALAQDSYVDEQNVVAG